MIYDKLNDLNADLFHQQNDQQLQQHPGHGCHWDKFAEEGDGSADGSVEEIDDGSGNRPVGDQLEWVEYIDEVLPMKGWQDGNIRDPTVQVQQVGAVGKGRIDDKPVEGNCLQQ